MPQQIRRFSAVLCTLAALLMFSNFSYASPQNDPNFDSMMLAAANPCAANPCAANPCGIKKKLKNPCAAVNPCAVKNPCGAKNPCAVNPCAAKNPCAANPCAANPCAAKKKWVNPCAAKNPCSN